MTSVLRTRRVVKCSRTRHDPLVDHPPRYLSGIATASGRAVRAPHVAVTDPEGRSQTRSWASAHPRDPSSGAVRACISGERVSDRPVARRSPARVRTSIDLVGGVRMERPYEIVQTETGPVYRIRARGTQVMREPLVFRGTAFTQEERAALGLVGLLPHGVTTIDSQSKRVYAQYVRAKDDLAKNVYLTSLRDRNEVLFYRLLSEHVDEMLPIIYTPTIGQAIERYSHEYRRPRGVFLSIDHQDQIEQSLANFGRAADEVDLIVATDSEGVLGIGDQGIGGIEIAIGKLTVYIAAAGIHPRRVIPVVLDAGTDNQALLTDPMYLGNRHARVRGKQYDEFIDAYVRAAHRMFPHAMLHWEDFGVDNARRILDRYADEVCTFNDDMQGTAAVALAAAAAGVRAAGSRMRDQRVVVLGPGTAGVGIADFLREAMVRDGLVPHEADRRIWLVGR